MERAQHCFPLGTTDSGWTCAQGQIHSGQPTGSAAEHRGPAQRRAAARPGALEGMHEHPEALRRPPGTISTLLTGCTPIQNKKLEEKAARFSPLQYLGRICELVSVLYPSELTSEAVRPRAPLCPEAFGNRLHHLA